MPQGSKLTAPSAPPVIDPNAAQSQSNPAASKPTITAQDDDGWVVQSASSGLTATAEELKARAETVKVDDPVGRRDVRPGAKDSLNPDAAAKDDEPAPAKKDEAPAGDKGRDDKGRFAKKDEAPEAGEAATAGKEEEPPAGDEPAKAGDGKKALPPRLPGETRDQYRSRIRKNIVQNQIDDETRRRYELQRENERLEQELEKKRRALTEGEPAAKTDEPPPLPAAKDDPKPTWQKFRDEGKTWDEYQDARAAWEDREFERRASELEQRVSRKTTTDQVVQQRAKAFQERVQAARQAHPDFDEVIGGLEMENTPFIARLLGNHPQGAELMYYLGQRTELAADLAELTAPVDLGNGQRGMHPSHGPIFEALMTSPDPAKLLTALLDPEAGHFERIAGLQGAHAFRELVLLESGSAAPAPAGNGTGRSPAKPEKKTAAPPLRPPSGAADVGKEVPPDPDDLPFGPEFVRQENARDRARGRRY